MFCEGAIFVLAVWIALSIWLIKNVSEGFGGFVIFCSVIFYFMSDIEEFKKGHITHGVLGATPIILFILLIIVGIVFYIKDENIRKKETHQIPDRVEKYISMHGYTSTQDFIKYSNEDSEFENARKVQYTNPLYTKQVEENKKREQNKQKPLQITEVSVAFKLFSTFRVQLIVHAVL